MIFLSSFNRAPELRTDFVRNRLLVQCQVRRRLDADLQGVLERCPNVK
ncbi:unnamed protein product [Ixodes pacificus]